MSLCQYKDAFGKPNEGMHKYRIPIINLGAVDVASTAVGALAINYLFFPEHSFWLVFAIVIIIGIFVHKAFCVDTQLNKYIFGESAAT